MAALMPCQGKDLQGRLSMLVSPTTVKHSAKHIVSIPRIVIEECIIIYDLLLK